MCGPLTELILNLSITILAQFSITLVASMFLYGTKNSSGKKVVCSVLFISWNVIWFNDKDYPSKSGVISRCGGHEKTNDHAEPTKVERLKK